MDGSDSDENLAGLGLVSDEGTDTEDIKGDPTLAQIKLLKPQFTPTQLDRFDNFRKVTFGKPAVREIMKRVTKKTANEAIVVAMIGITKVFVGELVETSRTAMDERGELGPIQPRHIREAYRRLKMANKIPYFKKQRKVFRRR
uniref:TAFII28-like protein domain-containing protein n=1 Tax=Vannella robusta TaxID=1487602 RepID=A0A7S4M734_9EUKA